MLDASSQVLAVGADIHDRVVQYKEKDGAPLTKALCAGGGKPSAPRTWTASVATRNTCLSHCFSVQFQEGPHLWVPPNLICSQVQGISLVI